MLALLGAIMAVWISITTAQNQIRTSRANGPEVVEAVVDEVRGNCVLAQDNLLLRRLAYVESRDGTDVDTFRSGFYGGIWQITQAMYDQTKTSPYLQQMRQDISEHLLIDWESTSWQDLLKPLYSGLAAALYLEDTLRDTAHPVGIPQQERFWNQFYQRGSAAANTFSQRANVMELGCHSQAEMDIAFIMDTSSSISPTDFQDAKNFIINTTSIFDINNGVVRVALITYADMAQVKVDWGQATSHASLDSIIRGLSYDTGATETAKALDLARTRLFSRARPNAVKVVVLVTDGRSHDTIDTMNAASQLFRDNPGILILSVGVGEQVDQTELHQISSEPSCKHTFQVARYDQIDALEQEIQRLTCRAPLSLHVNENVTCSLGQCPPYVVQVPRNTSVMAVASSTCSNGVRVYSSSTVPYPSAVNSDVSIILAGSQTSDIFYIPITNTSSLFYINTDQTTYSPALRCDVTLSILPNVVRVECVDQGLRRACTPADIINFKQTSGVTLCP